MSPSAQAQKISLEHAAYNADHAEAFGLVFKLAYHFENKEQPRLEIFLDDAEAKAREWRIYGTLLDESDARFAEARFRHPGEQRDIEIGALRLTIIFEDFRTENRTYPSGARERVVVYDFNLTPLA